MVRKNRKFHAAKNEFNIHTQNDRDLVLSYVFWNLFRSPKTYSVLNYFWKEYNEKS